MTDEDFREMAAEAIRSFSRRQPDEAGWRTCSRSCATSRARSTTRSVYEALATALEEFDAGAGQPLARAFYLSTAPEFFPVIIEALGERRLAQSHEDARCASSSRSRSAPRSPRRRSSTARSSSVFEEKQVFRIDHYLGKETVQNMLAFRFANGMFEPLWNRNYIDNVQITAAEDIGIGSRAGYYDHAGALRDLVQNHMLQLLTLLCMEPPVAFSADEVRDEKVKVLHAIRAPTARTSRR